MEHVRKRLPPGFSRRLPAHLGKCPSERTGLLGTEIEGLVLLALVEFPQVRALLLVDDGEDAGDALADNADSRQLRRRAAGDLLDAQLEKLLLELFQLLGQIRLGLGLQFVCLDFGLSFGLMLVIRSIIPTWQSRISDLVVLHMLVLFPR